jgi:HEPN domain-containing protein
MCHLTLEKTLKAIAAEAQGRTPPKTHDLLYLVTLGSVKPSQEHLDFIGKLNNASIPTRYPEDLAKIVSVYPKKVAEHYLDKTKEVMAWLTQDPRLKRS